jgi:hypothetical protein
MSELLALVHIANVYLNDRAFQRTDAVVQGYRGMGVGSCVEHDAVVGKAYFLHLVNQLSLHIALIVFYLYIGILCLQLRQILIERCRAVDAWLASAQEVKIGSVDNENFHNSNKMIIFAAAKVRISE